MIYHVYWGTAGNAGLYLDEIIQSLNNAGYSQKAFVSYYYPFGYGEKVFFKRTEMEHCRYKGLVRRILQAIEFLYAFIRIFICAIKDKPQVINYSYVSRGNLIILIFLKLWKRVSGCRLVITCHDVIPIIEDKNSYNKEISIKKKIYALADYYLVHTDNSKRELQELFNVTDNQILQHIFPLMDLSKLDDKNPYEVRFDFLFIGHMRPEKGIDLLVEAWLEFHKLYPESRLCIAGNPNYFEAYLKEREKQCGKNNIDLVLDFIKEEDYIKLVKSARCVVFPYTGGTNSGVISTVVSLGRDVITSDFGMFVDNPFVPKENMFRTGDKDSLIAKLVEYKKGLLISDSNTRVTQYRTRFNLEVLDVYSTITK